MATNNRFKGHASIPTTYDPTYWGPLDTRTLVPNKAALTKYENWQPAPGADLNAFNGMLVSVADDLGVEGVYCLVDVGNITDEAAWKKLSFETPTTDPENYLRVIILDENQNLPIPGQNNTLYLKHSKTGAQDNYSEYLHINGKYEIIGSNSVNLTNYYTKAEIDNKITQMDADLRSVIGGIQTSININTDNIAKIDNSVAALANSVSSQGSNIQTIQNQLDLKVDMQRDEAGKEYRLLSPAEQDKLAALELNDGKIEVSGSIKAENVSELDSWITKNRDNVPGLYPEADQSRLYSTYTTSTGVPVSALKYTNETIILES